MKIGVIGNIGVGKTTLCRFIEDELPNFVNKSVIVNYEPQDVNPYMEDFYKDPKRWAFASQLFFLKKKFVNNLNNQDGNVIYVNDRIIDEDVYVFAETLKDSGMIEERDWNNYIDTYELMKPHLYNYDFIIYLKGSVKHISENIIKRGREYEKGISIDYLNALNIKYDNLYKRLKSTHINVMSIDCDNVDIESSEDFRYSLYEKIAELTR